MTMERDDQAVIHPLRDEEIPAVITLWQAAGLVRPWNDPHTDITTALACASSTVLAAHAGNALVGTVMAGFDGHRGWLYYLAVAEDHRRKGLGRALVAAAEAWLAERGAPKVQLMIRSENKAVADFYEKIGYERSDVMILGKRL
ncbi:MAG: acetyltransferase [Sphingomonas bacterium]|nr:acetyltransferase [Sphingomonas bacterium]